MKQGWEIKKLGEIGKVSMCKRVFKEDTTPEGDIPFYKIGTFGKSPDAFITKAKYDEFRSKFSFPKKGDILISASGTIGRRVRYDGEPAYFQDSNIVWIDNDEKQVLNDYLYRFYEICNWKSTKGATISRLYNDNLKQIEIPFPKSLPEQQRIVSILDECFASIAKAKANAEQNLKNAKELFESYLENLFTEIYNSNETKTISELAKVIGGYSFKSGDFKKEGKYQVIRMGNVRPGIIRENESPVFINELDEKALAKALLQRNDVIITQTGTKKKRDYGFTVIIEKENYLLNQRIAAIRFSEKYLPKFFLYFSWTNLFKDQYFANETGTVGQGNVGIGAITDAKVPFIKIEQQEEFISKIDVILAETERLGNIYQKKLNDLDEMKKSVLQKAFAGELKTEKALAI